MMEQADKTVRILFVVRSLHVGGMEQMVIELATALHGMRHEVRFCTIEDAGQLAGMLPDGIRLDALNKPPGLRLDYVFRLRALLNDWRPDIIHSHNETGHFYASLANIGNFRKTKLVHTKHGRGDPEDRKSTIRNDLSSRLSDAIVAVSEDVADVCRDYENVPARKVRTIINGIGLDPYLRISRDETGRKPIVFGHVGRLTDVKNQKLLINAFNTVHQKLPQTRLVIAGEGPLRSALGAQVHSLGLASSVTFLGYQSDIPKVLSQLDIFLLTSVSEGTPLVVIEAMAAGCPVIATNVGGLSEMIENQCSGILVPTEDEGSLADRMLELARDAERRDQLGRKGREVASARYGLDRMAGDYRVLYESVLRS